MEQLEKIYTAYKNGAAICTDTRSIHMGCIFFALKGTNFNGNTFVGQALDMGAIFAVADEPAGIENAKIIKVDDVLLFLQELARHHRKQLGIPFIGITGSNGKTTTKELFNKVLASKFKTLCTRGNLNNHIGVPLTVLEVNKTHEIAIIEMGANHQGEIELLCSIALPTHVLITNVGKAHLEGFGGFEGVKKGKGEMYRHAKEHNAVVFINGDNTDLKEMLGEYQNTVTYGTNENANISGRVIDGGNYVSLEWKSKDNDVWHTLQSQITGTYNFENILSAVAAGCKFGVNPGSINAAVASYKPDNQRSQEIIKEKNYIILDAYNANPTSMTAALNNFVEHCHGKRAVLLGDMFELGNASAKEHELISDMVAGLNFDLTVLVGPEFRSTKPIPEAHYFNTSSEAANWLRSKKLAGYNILVKGSRGSKMEVVLEAIE